MALTLKHQTATQFAQRFWNRVRHARQNDKILFSKLIAWLLSRIANGDITDTQARNSFNSVFERSLTAGQWSTLKTTRLQPIADRYNAMLAESDL